MEVITGILLGLSTLLFVGPVFFYLLKATLEHSAKAGIAVAIGIIVGDIIYVLIVINGLSSFLEQPDNQKWFALVGSIFLIGIGIKYLIRTTPNIEDNKKLFRSLPMYAAKGFLINFINPFVIAVWVLFLGVNQSKFDNQASIIISFIVTLVVIFLTDCLKVLFAHRLKKFIATSRLKLVFKLFGILMMIFGLRLLLLYFERF